MFFFWVEKRAYALSITCFNQSKYHYLMNNILSTLLSSSLNLPMKNTNKCPETLFGNKYFKKSLQTCVIKLLKV